MRAEAKLKAVREKCSSCDLLAFIDLDTSMVLASDAARTVAQERLNSMAEMAVDVFAGSDSEKVAELLGWSAPIRRAIFHSSDQVSVLMHGQESDAVCSLGSNNADFASIIQAAQTALDSLADVEN